MNSVAISQTYRGEYRPNEPMAKHTSWRAGGTADHYYIPADIEDCAILLASLDKQTPITWVGLGSNMLVRDGGLRGVVIAPLQGMNQIALLDNGQVFTQCGVTCARLARICQQNQLAGADFFAGIPGTVGGALAMNAGAFGSETWTFVNSVELFDQQGELVNKQAGDFEIAYRSVQSYQLDKPLWFASANFQFEKEWGKDRSNIKHLLQKRNQSQPIGLPSCGSVFKNPKNDFAARLIEQSGLKEFCIGDACVSAKHANFIINTGQASANDIESLIQHIQQTVKQDSGIELQTEVKIIGELVSGIESGESDDR